MIQELRRKQGPKGSVWTENGREQSHGTKAHGLIPLLGLAADLPPAVHHFLMLMSKAVCNLRTFLAEPADPTSKRLWGERSKARQQGLGLRGGCFSM